MVKINHKSKRMPAKRRYKIEKRVRDHNKKTRKEARKTDQKKSKKKNIVIPNKFPLKEEILLMSEKQKQAALEEKKRQKEERKKQKKEAKEGKTTKKSQDSIGAKTIDELLNEAAKKQSQFDRMQAALLSSGKSPFEEWSKRGGDKETSLKTFYKEFKKVVDAADVIIEVLDARDPIGSRCPQAEEMIATSGGNKKLILLINKIDLVPKENVQKWLKYFRSQYPTVAFKSSTQNQNEKLSHSSVPINAVSDNLLRSSKCLGANILLKLLNNYTRTNNEIKQSITVGIIGLPNVGKSSVINSLKRSHACMIGSVPGLTRCMQEIKLDKHIKLLDSPGIVMSKDEDAASLALKNCIKIESMEDPLAPIELLVQRCNKEQLVSRYLISTFSDATEFLNLVAKRYGKMKKNGIPDLKKAAQMILNDWNNGKLTYYTLPPENANKVVETKLVTEPSPVLDIDALLKDDEDELFEDMDDDTKLIVKGVEVSTSAPIKTNFEMLEKEGDDEDNSDSENKVKFKTDLSLNKKVEKKVQKLSEESNGKKSILKRKSRGGEESEDENNNNDEDDTEEEIYKTEDIPRTKKMQKIEMKKRQKKARKTDKIFTNLGDMLNNVNLEQPSSQSSSKKQLYDFKKDFKN